MPQKNVAQRWQRRLQSNMELPTPLTAAEKKRLANIHEVGKDTV
jgi:hypothetical protein